MFHTFSCAFYQMEAGNKSKGFRKGSVEFNPPVQTVTSKVHIHPWYYCLVAMVDNNQGNNQVIIKCFLSVLTNQVCLNYISPPQCFFFFFKSAFGQGLKIPLSVHPPHLRAQLVVSARGLHLSDQRRSSGSVSHTLQEIGLKCAVEQMSRGSATCDSQVLLTLGKSCVKWLMMLVLLLCENTKQGKISEGGQRVTDAVKRWVNT